MTDPFLPVQVIYKKLTGKIRGFCCLGSDFEPIIIINDDLSPEQKKKTYKHELDHIRKGEIYNVTYNEYGEDND